MRLKSLSDGALEHFQGFTFLAEDAAEVDVVAIAEGSAVGGDALASVATRVLVDAGVDRACSNPLEKKEEYNETGFTK